MTQPANGPAYPDFVNELFQQLLKREPRDDDLSRVSAKLGGAFTFQELFSHLTSTREYLMNNHVRSRFPAGHYHSPIVDPQALGDYVQRQRAGDASEIPGIVIDLEHMQQVWNDQVEWLKLVDLPKEKTPGRRYHETGGPFPLGDALALGAMMRMFRPQRIVEIGSGFSTASMLDVAEQLGLDNLTITCIEPFPTRLKSLLWPEDAARVTLIEQTVQDVPLEIFAALQPNDFLFIDSTHVLKTGSDVHYELFQILPRLRPGVLVHLHDCPFPFEYPDKWIFELNHSWNEVYAIRAYLMFNPRCQVFFWPTMLKRKCAELVRRSFPEYLRVAASSLWLRII